jgi:phosphoribosylglycinamide formyltransferase-1
MLTLGVLVSGGGSNLQAILDAIDQGALDARVATVISNKSEAYALERAREARVPAMVIDHNAYATREAFDGALVDALRALSVECVVLAGFMRIVTPVLLDAFPDRVVNIHPALLPAFPGVNGPKQALAYGVRVAGCTVHFVDGGMDTGPILTQAAVPVVADDTEESLAARILGTEHVLLPRALQWIAEGRVRVVRDGKPGARPRVHVEGVGALALGLSAH